MPHSHHHFLLGIFTFALLTTALCDLAMADDSRSLDWACKLYSAGDFQRCAKLVDSLLLNQPKDPSAHFIKGNCLVNLKKFPEAIHEYALVEHYSPGSKLAAQAKSAGANLTLFQLKSSAETNSVNDKRLKHLPPGTLELIRKQAEQARLRATEMGQFEADNEKKMAANQARTEQERAERMVQTGHHRGDTGAVSNYDAELLRNRAQANAELLKRNGEMRAAWKEQEANEKAENLQRQAEDLEDQLINNRASKYGTVKLNPVGTNLYTRNYSSTRPPVKALDAQAFTLPGDAGLRRTSVRMPPVGKTSPKVVPGRYGADANGACAETKVKGQVVPR